MSEEEQNITNFSEMSEEELSKFLIEDEEGAAEGGEDSDPEPQEKEGEEKEDEKEPEKEEEKPNG